MSFLCRMSLLVRRLFVCCLLSVCSARQPQEPLRNQIALDLRRAAHDRLRARIQILTRDMPAVGTPCVVDRAGGAEDLHRRFLQALIGLAAENLFDGAFHARLPALQEPRQTAIADEAEDLDLDV